MKLKDSLIIFLLSIMALVAEFFIYLITSISIGFSGDIGDIKYIVQFFIYLMIFTIAVGVLSPICALVELMIKKENIGTKILAVLLGLILILLFISYFRTF